MEAVQKGIYRHFKGNVYEVVSSARHSETGEEMVVYRDVTDPTKCWVRPAAMWTESVTRDGVTQPRFAYLSPASKRVYDISQEVFTCRVYPGDPAPQRQVLSTFDEGSPYYLTAFSMCAHNGTHVDAPFHFIPDGKTVDQLPLEAMVGPCCVATCQGEIDRAAMTAILKGAKQQSEQAAKRILIRGKATLTMEAAQVLAASDVLLYGNESQTVGPEDAPMAVHRLLLGRQIVLLEGIRLSDVRDGVYLLCAAPINLGGGEGAPCRAVLVE